MFKETCGLLPEMLILNFGFLYYITNGNQFVNFTYHGCPRFSDEETDDEGILISGPSPYRLVQFWGTTNTLLIDHEFRK